MKRDLFLATLGILALIAAAVVWAARSSGPKLEHVVTPAPDQWRLALAESMTSRTTGLDLYSPDAASDRLTVLWDYSCDGCRRIATVIDSLRRARPGTAVTIVPLALPDVSDRAPAAAAAAFCAAEQDRFPQFHEAWVHSAAGSSTWVGLAEEAGVSDPARYETCLESERVRKLVARNVLEAQKASLPGVPLFVGPGGLTLGSAHHDLSGIFLSGDAGNSAPLHRDSAGILLVDTPPSHLVPLLRTDDVPSVVLGGGDGEGALFRVIGAVHLSDGLVVVGNSGADELLFFSVADGRVAARAGGSGGGPGEFGWLRTLGRFDRDSIWTYDLGLFRLSRFDSRGSLLGTVTLHPPVGGLLQPQVLGTFADGSLAVWQEAFEIATRGPERLITELDTVFRYVAEAGEAETVVSFPGTEYVVSREPSSVGNAPRFGRTPRIFGGRPILAMVQGELVVADNRRFELSFFDSRGRLTRKIRRRTPNREVASDDVLALLEESPKNRPAAVTDPAVLDWLRSRSENAAGEFPVLGSTILEAHDGRLWVSEHDWPRRDWTGWSVIEPTGSVGAYVLVPADLRVTDAGEDWVLGVWEDDLGIEYVMKYSLTPCAQPAGALEAIDISSRGCESADDELAGVG